MYNTISFQIKVGVNNYKAEGFPLTTQKALKKTNKY